MSQNLAPNLTPLVIPKPFPECSCYLLGIIIASKQMASDTLFFQRTLQRRWTIIHNLPHVKGIFKNVKPSMKFNVLIFRCINIFVRIPSPKIKKNLWKRGLPKRRKGISQPRKTSNFQWKIRGKFRETFQGSSLEIHQLKSPRWIAGWIDRVDWHVLDSIPKA